MTSNQNPEGRMNGIETTDDVEGHGARFTGIDPEATDDVEGHGIRGQGFEPDATDDVEAHGGRTSH